MTYNSKSLTERFNEKVQMPSSPNGCWQWTANKNNKGYGMLQETIAGRHGKRLAHRIAYALYRGPIPRGACVLHRCDNPACVNPLHLFLGTKKDNYDDMVAKGRRVAGPITHIPVPPRGDDHWTRKNPEAIQGSNNGFAKLSEADVRTIYAMRLKGQKAEHIAAHFDMDPSTIGDIIKGEHWSHMLGTPGCPTLEQLQLVKTARAPSKLTPAQAREIKTRIKNGESIKPLAREFGLAFQTVSDIKRGKSWAFIDV